MLESSIPTCDVSTVLLECMRFHPLAPIPLIGGNFVGIVAKGNLSMARQLAPVKIVAGTIFLVFLKVRKLGSGQS